MVKIYIVRHTVYIIRVAFFATGPGLGLIMYILTTLEVLIHSWLYSSYTFEYIITQPLAERTISLVFLKFHKLPSQIPIGKTGFRNKSYSVARCYQLIKNYQLLAD